MFNDDGLQSPEHALRSVLLVVFILTATAAVQGIEAAQRGMIGVRSLQDWARGAAAAKSLRDRDA